MFSRIWNWISSRHDYVPAVPLVPEAPEPEHVLKYPESEVEVFSHPDGFYLRRKRDGFYLIIAYHGLGGGIFQWSEKREGFEAPPYGNAQKFLKVWSDREEAIKQAKIQESVLDAQKDRELFVEEKVWR